MSRPDHANTIPALPAEESRANRLQRQKARLRDRGGIFVPPTQNPLLDILLARSVTGESPKKKRPPTRTKGRQRAAHEDTAATHNNGSENEKPASGSARVKSQHRRPSTKGKSALAPIEEDEDSVTALAKGLVPKRRGKPTVVHGSDKAAMPATAVPKRRGGPAKPKASSALVSSEDVATALPSAKPKPRARSKKPSITKRSVAGPSGEDGGESDYKPKATARKPAKPRTAGTTRKGPSKARAKSKVAKHHLKENQDGQQDNVQNVTTPSGSIPLSSIIPLAETAPKDDSPNPKLPLTSCPEPSDLDDELELRPQRPRQPANHGPKGKSNDLHRSADEGPERVVSAISSFHGTSKPVHKESEPEYGEARARGKATPEMLVIPERTGRPSSGTERAGGEGGGGVRGRKRKVALAVESDLRGPLEARILVASVDEEDASGSRVRKRSKAAPREDTAGCGQGGIGEDGEGVGSDARQMKAKQRDEAKPASKKRPREADAGAEAEVAAKRPPAKASSTAAQKRAKVVVDGQPGRAKGRSAPGLKDGVLARPRSRNLGENTAAAAQRGKSRQGGRGAGLKPPVRKSPPSIFQVRTHSPLVDDNEPDPIDFLS